MDRLGSAVPSADHRSVAIERGLEADERLAQRVPQKDGAETGAIDVGLHYARFATAR